MRRVVSALAAIDAFALGEVSHRMLVALTQEASVSSASHVKLLRNTRRTLELHSDKWRDWLDVGVMHTLFLVR